MNQEFNSGKKSGLMFLSSPLGLTSRFNICWHMQRYLQDCTDLFPELETGEAQHSCVGFELITLSETKLKLLGIAPF